MNARIGMTRVADDESEPTTAAERRSRMFEARGTIACGALKAHRSQDALHGNRAWLSRGRCHGRLPRRLTLRLVGRFHHHSKRNRLVEGPMGNAVRLARSCT